MAHRLTDTEIWKKDWFLDLTDKQKLLTKFLFDNCDCAGFYRISWHLLRCSFSEAPTREDFEAIKQVKFIEDDLIFIEDFVFYQYKVQSFNELNPKNNAHKGVLKLLEKYNIYLAPQEPLTSPSLGAQDKDKDKDKDNISTISLKEKEIKKEKEKIDPYFSSAKSNFQTEWQKVFEEKPYLQRQHCFKLIELEEDIENFRAILPDALQKLKRLKFDDIDFNPRNADWLLRDCNFSKLMNGAFDNQLEVKRKSVAEILAEIEEKKSGQT